MGTVAAKAPVPHFVGRYEVLVPIASGGMATVYLARSRGAGGFEREVALKLTHMHLRDSQEFQSLLVEEAKLASTIRHHNVVSVLDVGDDPLGLFLVMDYVEGDTLSGLIRRAKSSGDLLLRPIAMRALLDALAGLHAAHETKDTSGKALDLVHRDFSPQNIIVGTDGVAKLTDFGIAKAASRTANTSTGVLKGKIAYMSPEQARGLPLDRRADVWAAGVLAWEIVTGRSLWPREQEDVATLIKLVTEPPPRLRAIDPTISEALDDVVARALEMDPAKRTPTAAAFSKALAAVVPSAEAEEVAEYVRKSAGPKIEQRREQIRALGTLRMQMGEIAETTQMTPSGNYLRAPPPASVEMKPVAPESDATEVVSGPVLAPITATAADSTVNIRGIHAMPRWIIPVGVLGVLVVAGAAYEITVRSRASAPSITTSTVTAPGAVAASGVAPPPEALPSATVVTEQHSPPPPTPTAKPSVHVATTSARAEPTPTATAMKPAPTTKTTKLAPSPY